MTYEWVSPLLAEGMTQAEGMVAVQICNATEKSKISRSRVTWTSKQLKKYKE